MMNADPIPITGGDDPFDLPLDLAPMEARSSDILPGPDKNWQYEPKWDGFRCLAFKKGRDVDLRAKSGKPLGRFFPEIVDLLRTSAAKRFVLDGELVVQIDGRLSFNALQMRLHPAESRIRKLALTTPANLVLFDALAASDGEVILQQPLTYRRAVLENIVDDLDLPDRVILSPCTQRLEIAKKWLENAGHGSTDGVVAKRLDGAYLPGKRSMVKVKQLRTADCVVGGFRYERATRFVGSLLLGLYDKNGKLNHVGFTSTIPATERGALTRRLEELRKPPGFTGDAPGGPSRWSDARSTEWEPLSPELVVEVRYDHVTGGRFRHGTKLVRWRPDKSPGQCRYEQIAPTSVDFTVGNFNA